MKKTLLTILVLVCCLTAYAINNSKEIMTRTLFNAVAITASESATSAAIELEALQPEGYFSFTLTTAGASSVVKAEFLVCNTIGGTYYEPSGADDIVTAHSPGTAVYSFTPPVAKYMKIKLTETSGNNVTSATGIITIQ
jgi:hypothetical protein